MSKRKPVEVQPSHCCPSCQTVFRSPDTERTLCERCLRLKVLRIVSRPIPWPEGLMTRKRPS